MWPRLGLGMTTPAVAAAAASIEEDDKVDLMLVVSRRQVDCDALGGGYLGPTTEELSHLAGVEQFPLCRDHGGPWQGRGEADLSESAAMERALASIRTDIDNGFRLIHIDTSRERRGHAAYWPSLHRLLHLYGEADRYAKDQGRDVAFEVGLEAQGPHPADLEMTRVFIDAVVRGLEGLSLPTFFVLQTGTKVQEHRNVGDITKAGLSRAALESVKAATSLVREAGMRVKAHNADYLPRALIAELMRSGVYAMNVAPEFGVAQTKELLATARGLGLDAFANEFVQIAVESGEWRPWVTDAQAEPETRALLAGNYVMRHPRITEGVAQIDSVLSRSEDSFGQRLQRRLKEIIRRYTEVYPR